MRLDSLVGVGTLLLTAGQLSFGLRCDTCRECKGIGDKGKLVDDESSDSCRCDFEVPIATYPNADLETITYERRHGFNKIAKDFCTLAGEQDGKFTFYCYCGTDGCDACKLGPWPKKKKITCQSCGDGGCNSVEDDGSPIECEDSSCKTEVTIEGWNNDKTTVKRGCGIPVTSDSCISEFFDGTTTRTCYCTSNNCNKGDGEAKPKKCPSGN